MTRPRIPPPRSGAGLGPARVFVLFFFLFSLPLSAAAQRLPLGKIRLPPGFRIELYAEGIPGARSMALGARGTLFVGSRRQGRLYAVIDKDRDGRADKVITLAEGLFWPNGVAYRKGALFVAEINRILRFDRIEDRLEGGLTPDFAIGGFPQNVSHGWKFIRFGPGGWLYVPVGAPCNICEPGDPYAAIHRVRPDGSKAEIFARGVRNTVGFDWHPVTKELWFTDNGRDQMGDDLPPDELNRAPRKGMHFGYPYCHGKAVPDPAFGRGKSCGNYTPPAQELGPHVAALGMRFYTGGMFPAEYRNQIFIAEHGSWNRSVPIGYRVTLVRLKRGRAASYEVFAEGWLEDGKSWGRPVDILVMPDGALLVSDDKAGAIYRITYRK